MAAVRYAMRRLGGSLLQGTRVAVAEERRRFVHTDECSREQVIREIQQKKEELYDVIYRADKEFFIYTWWDRKLAHELCMQVTPRPFDSYWRRLRLVKRVNSVIETAGLVGLSSMLALTIYLGVLVLGALEEQAAQPPLTSKGSGDNI